MLRFLFQKKKKGKKGYLSTEIPIGKWYYLLFNRANLG